MPIVVGHTSGADQASLALMAGAAQGNAQRMSQQRQIDAGLTSQILGQKHDLKRVGMARRFQLEDQSRAESRDNRIRKDNMDLAFERLRVQEQDIQGRQREATKNAASLAEQQAIEQQQRNGMLAQLDEAYAGRPKDLLYEQGKAQIQNEGKLTDRTASALGIHTEQERRMREQSEQDGTLDQFTPMVASERRARRTLEIGQYDDIGKQLAEMSRPSFGPRSPNYNDVMDAAIQVEGWARVTDDPTQLEAAIETFSAQGVTDDVLQPIRQRIREVNIQEMKVKAPQAFEIAMGAFESQALQAATALGRPLQPAESAQLLGDALERSLQSAGIPANRFEEWVEGENDILNQAYRSVEQTVRESFANEPGGGGDPRGSEETYGSDSEPVTVEDFPGVEITPDGQVTLPEYLIPIDPGNPQAGFIDKRTGRRHHVKDVLAPYMQQQQPQQE